MGLSFRAIFLMLFIAQTAFGQEVKVDSFLLIEEIIISENRLQVPLSAAARNIYVIDKAQISATPITNIPDLLQYVGGVDVRRRGVGSVQTDIGIRGSTFNQVQVLVDGVRMSDPQTGHHNMNLPVNVQDIERVEIVKGPAARIYGMNAMAGAINIITSKTFENEFDINLGLEAGSFDTYGINLAAKYGSDVYDQSLSLNHTQSKGYRYNTDFEITTLNYNGKLKAIQKAPIDIKMGLTDRAFGANGFYASEDFIDQYEEVSTGFVSVSSSIIAGNTVIRPQVSWRNNHDDYVFLRQNPTFFNNIHTSNSYRGELNVSHVSKYGQSGFGLEYTRETLSSNNLGDRSRNVFGFFLDHRVEIEDLDFTFGLYGNKVSEYDLAIYPGFDIGYNFVNDFHAFATVNWSNRIPTYTNLYYNSSAEQGNPNLVSESAFAYELGLKRIISNGSFTVSGFVRKNNNLIDWAKDSINQEKWIALNFNEVIVRGIDLSVNYDIARKMGSNRQFTLSFNYVFIDAEVIDNKTIAISRYALENLKHQLNFGLTYEVIPDLKFSAFYRYFDRVSLEDYNLIDTRIGYDFGRFIISLDLNNLLDQTYRETNLVPMPGRNFRFRLNYKLKK